MTSTIAAVVGTTDQQRCSEERQSGDITYHHMIVLVHGYMGSYREQEYLGEALLAKTRTVLDGDDAAICRRHDHKFSILHSKANTKDTTDGIAKGGERLAAEISDWIQEQTEAESSESTIVPTLSLIGNSLGGLYSRYALAELDALFRSDSDDDDGIRKTKVRPLVFCTTSSPHLGTSRETFVRLPEWTEPYVSSAFGQRTMDDLFRVHNSTVIADMCRRPDRDRNPPPPADHEARKRVADDDDVDYLSPLGRFRKRVAVANAYNTDFLVSVSSGAFVSSESDSTHHGEGSEFEGSRSFRWMRDAEEHVALQVATVARPENDTPSDDDDETTVESCVNALDDLGWHKIFVDTRGMLPSFANLDVPGLPPKASYASRELREHFQQYGTLLPVAHPLNMANSRTDWYRKLTRSGRPVMDAFAELVVLDMIELSEEHKGP